MTVRLVLSLVGVRRPDSQPRPFSCRVLALVIGLTNLALVGLSCSHLFQFSSWLPDAEGAPAVGAAAPDFTLVDQHGKAVALSSLRGQQTVLVFYRGFW